MNPKLIKQLPQSVQNLIGEFNVEHRTQMKCVLDSWPVACYNCQDRIMRKDAIVWMWMNHYYCSELCEWIIAKVDEEENEFVG